jgi:hypothetical protein
VQTSATVTDYLEGVAHSHLPQPGAVNALETAFAGSILQRDLGVDLGHSGVYSAQDIVTRHLGGASSYDQMLTRAVMKGDNTFHVQTVRGLFRGQRLRVTAQPGAYGGGEDVTVKSLGVRVTPTADRGSVLETYFVTQEPAGMDHPFQALVYNKNAVNGLAIHDVSNCDNQSAGLQYDKTVYGIGDSFILSGKLTYQGDIISGLGDEGGVGVTLSIHHDLDCFWGEVESWNPGTGELVYATGGTSPQKLGTSRPLINMNPDRVIPRPGVDRPADRVMVFYPNHDPLQLENDVVPNYSPIAARKRDVGWDASIVGRFIAIDEPSECYDLRHSLPDGTTAGHRVHRWWHITGLFERRSGYDGETYCVLAVESHLQAATERMGPILFRGDNYTSSSGGQPVVKLLKYMIAPGTWVSDARHGIAGNVAGSRGIATAGEERRLVLAPSPTVGTQDDFAAGDPITNPPGPDPWLPTGVRMLHYDNYPGRVPGFSFLARNDGNVQLGAGLLVDSGNAPTMELAALKRKDGRPSYQNGVEIRASTGYGVKVLGDVADRLPGGEPGAAVYLQQTNVAGHPNVKAIQWSWGFDGSDPARHPLRYARLYVDPDSGNLVFTGQHIDCRTPGAGIVNARGLSASATPARNLCGIDAPVPSGASDLQVTFRVPEPDADYAVQVTPSWLTPCAVTGKTPQGFAVRFGTPAGAAAALDWVIVRGNRGQ